MFLFVSSDLGLPFTTTTDKKEHMAFNNYLIRSTGGGLRKFSFFFQRNSNGIRGNKEKNLK